VADAFLWNNGWLVSVAAKFAATRHMAAFGLEARIKGVELHFVQSVRPLFFNEKKRHGKLAFGSATERRVLTL